MEGGARIMDVARERGERRERADEEMMMTMSHLFLLHFDTLRNPSNRCSPPSTCFCRSDSKHATSNDSAATVRCYALSFGVCCCLIRWRIELLVNPSSCKCRCCSLLAQTAGHNAAACPTAGSPTCYNCGQQGHVSAQCGMEAQPKTCYRCNETGHISRECPNSAPAGAIGGAGGECYKCGQPGHIARSCPTAGGFGGPRGGFGGAGARTCYNCGGVGHLSRDCTSASGANAGGQRCYNCNETGHISRECPKPQTKSCYKCGSPDHLAAACTGEATA
ncbi:hypothetical protein ACQY0O_008356 [Thecaphora frezii]